MSFSIYTFRTCPYVGEIARTLGEPFVFGDLKSDLDIYCDQIRRTQPDYILGIAAGSQTYLEPVLSHFATGRCIVWRTS